jgi:hypothetical protein
MSMYYHDQNYLPVDVQKVAKETAQKDEQAMNELNKIVSRIKGQRKKA